MGLVPGEACAGDTIVVVPGGPVYLVARKTTVAHRLIGTAYIHGIIDGQALESDDQTLEETVVD
jgi:hypothetical protein